MATCSKPMVVSSGDWSAGFSQLTSVCWCCSTRRTRASGLLQLAVHARAGVAEAQRLRLDAVHQDDAHAGEGVVVELAVGRLHQVAPGEHLPIQRRALVS